MAKKTQTIAAKIPQTREQAEADMRELGAARIQIAEIDNKLKEDSQALIQAAKDAAEPLEAKVKFLVQGLSLYADAHRAELTDGNKTKTGKMLSGHFDWRKLPSKVSLRGVPAIIERIKAEIAKAAADDDTDRAILFKGFLRVKEEINKDAMLANPKLAKSITGVGINSAGERLEIVVYENSLAD